MFLLLTYLLLTYFTPFFSVSVVEFKQVNVNRRVPRSFYSLTTLNFRLEAESNLFVFIIELWGWVDIYPFHTTDLFLYPLKTLENPWFSDTFRGYWKRPVAWNGFCIFFPETKIYDYSLFMKPTYQNINQNSIMNKNEYFYMNTKHNLWLLERYWGKHSYYITDEVGGFYGSQSI